MLKLHTDIVIAKKGINRPNTVFKPAAVNFGVV